MRACVGITMHEREFTGASGGCTQNTGNGHSGADTDSAAIAQSCLEDLLLSQ